MHRSQHTAQPCSCVKTCLALESLLLEAPCFGKGFPLGSLCLHAPLSIQPSLQGLDWYLLTQPVCRTPLALDRAS